MAEAWLIAQDPYLKSDEFGQSIDEVENLIKKHEAFEKAAAAQEERFAALERLTTVRSNSNKFSFMPPLNFSVSLKLTVNWESGTKNLRIDDNISLPFSVRVERYEETTRGGAAGPRRHYREAEGRKVTTQILTQCQLAYL